MSASSSANRPLIERFLKGQERQVCGQIYQEAKDLPYMLNTFVILISRAVYIVEFVGSLGRSYDMYEPTVDLASTGQTASWTG